MNLGEKFLATTHYYFETLLNWFAQSKLKKCFKSL